MTEAELLQKLLAEYGQTAEHIKKLEKESEAK
jgi:hypothetical protein